IRDGSAHDQFIGDRQQVRGQREWIAAEGFRKPERAISELLDLACKFRQVTSRHGIEQGVHADCAKIHEMRTLQGASKRRHLTEHYAPTPGLTSKREIRRTYSRESLIFWNAVVKRIVCLAAVVVLFSCASSIKEGAVHNSCGPFGAPSAAVISDVKPNCGEGELLGPWKDADGIDRYACLYNPKSQAVHSKLPMIVYLHPSLFGAGWITQTNILELQNSVSLTDDPKQVGFIVLAPEGRKTTHYYPFPDNKGIGWDNWYRQLNPAGDVKTGDTIWRENADAATIDHFIAVEVATGKVDTARIYISGWSNGSAMGILYAVNRPNIAAAAVYSSPSPFGAFNDPCPQRPVAGPAA